MIEREDITKAANDVLAEVAGAANDVSAESADMAGAAADSAGKAEETGERPVGLFLVDVIVHGDQVEVFIDSDGTTADGKPRRVTVDDCVILTKAIESKFDRDAEDFSLTVSSSGIGQPLKALRQYRKLVGRQVEVVLNSGVKMVATLEAVEPAPDGGDADDRDIGSITLSYSEKQRVEGKKTPKVVAVTKTFALKDLKTTKEYIDFK